MDVPCHDLGVPDGRDLAECLAAVPRDERTGWPHGRLSDARSVEEASEPQRESRAQPGLEEAAQLLGLGDERIAWVWRPDAGADSPLTVELASDRRLRWERQADMLRPRELAFPVLAMGLGPDKPFTPAQAQEVYRALVSACETLEAADDLDQAREWTEQFIGIADPLVIPHDADDVAAFATLQDFRDRLRPEAGEEFWGPPLLSWPPYHYIRRADLAAFVREVFHERISWGGLIGRMGEVGWERHDLQMWTPDVPRDEAEHVRVRTFGQRFEEQ